MKPAYLVVLIKKNITNQQEYHSTVEIPHKIYPSEGGAVKERLCEAHLPHRCRHAPRTGCIITTDITNHRETLQQKKTSTPSSPKAPHHAPPTPSLSTSPKHKACLNTLLSKSSGTRAANDRILVLAMLAERAQDETSLYSHYT